MSHQITTSQVLKLCGGIARGTLYRWMDPAVAEQIGIEPFPAGGRKDAKSRVWELSEVEAWLDRNAPRLERHPHLLPRSEVKVDRSASVDLTLGQAYEAARRVAEEDQTGFDYGDFEERFINPMTAALHEALRSRGAKGAAWMGDKFAFIFPEGDEGDRQAVEFKLTFS